MRTYDQVHAQSMALLAPAFHTAEPLVAGLSQVLFLVEYYVSIWASTLRLGGSGAWMSLIGRADGIEPADGESADTYLARLRYTEDAVTPAAIRAAVARIVPDDASWQLVEHWTCQLFLHEDGGDSYVTDLFLNGRNMLGGNLAFTVVVDEGLDAGIYTGLYAEIHRLRAAGVTVSLIVEDDYVVDTALTRWATS
jgi:hypothetical protein